LKANNRYSAYALEGMWSNCRISLIIDIHRDLLTKLFSNESQNQHNMPAL